MRALVQLWASFVLAAFVSSVSAQDAQHGYILVTGWYKDSGAQRDYNRAVGPVLRAHQYETSVLGLADANMRVLEGDWIPGRMMLLIKFPSETRAEAFWWSDAYQKAKKIRNSASQLDIVQLDGLPGIAPIMNQESAYLVFAADVKDMQRLMAEYGQRAPELVREHKGTFIIRASRSDMELLEGAHPPGSLVVVEFPDTNSLREFWNSEEYRRLSEIRKQTGKWSVIEIVPPS